MSSDEKRTSSNGDVKANLSELGEDLLVLSSQVGGAVHDEAWLINLDRGGTSSLELLQKLSVHGQELVQN